MLNSSLHLSREISISTFLLYSCFNISEIKPEYCNYYSRNKTIRPSRLMVRADRNVNTVYLFISPFRQFHTQDSNLLHATKRFINRKMNSKPNHVTQRSGDFTLKRAIGSTTTLQTRDAIQRIMHHRPLTKSSSS